MAETVLVADAAPAAADVESVAVVETAVVGSVAVVGTDWPNSCRIELYACCAAPRLPLWRSVPSCPNSCDTAWRFCPRC